MIELNLNYNLSYSEIPPGTGCYTSVNISINGSGKRLAGSYPTLYTCTADISRSYSYSWQCDNESVTATIHPDFITYYGCPFDIMSVNLEQVLLPEGNYKYVYYIKNLIFYPVTIFIYDINECHNPGECIVNRVDNYSSDVLPVNYINGRHDFENDGSGSFPEYTWSNSITNESTNLKANLSVQMRVIY